ncbi:MAG: hypothetical protein OEU91_08140 [Gammaproteobacteria bacterium]|nr:hypothetical protein [Gammaproteobacteria bacterium]
MATGNDSVLEQLRRNSVAIISLVVALSSLGYNTWRNELTEDNRNQRFAAFEILLKLGELQQVVFHGHYDKDASDKGNPRTGWAYVLTVRDLSQVMGQPMTDVADELVATWSTHWQELGSSQDSADTVIAGIDHARERTLELLRSLE